MMPSPEQETISLPFVLGMNFALKMFVRWPERIDCLTCKIRAETAWQLPGSTRKRWFLFLTHLFVIWVTDDQKGVVWAREDVFASVIPANRVDLQKKKNLDWHWLDYLVLYKAKDVWHSDSNTIEPITESSGLFCISTQLKWSWIMKLHYPTNQLWNINRPRANNLL